MPPSRTEKTYGVTYESPYELLVYEQDPLPIMRMHPYPRVIRISGPGSHNFDPELASQVQTPRQPGLPQCKYCVSGKSQCFQCWRRFQKCLDPRDDSCGTSVNKTGHRGPSNLHSSLPQEVPASPAVASLGEDDIYDPWFDVDLTPLP